jgi:NAD(P)-dependent dehydrogenase (short-subunit alcohol dehydrogenase family)
LRGLTDKVAVVTGAASGIGEATAQRLAEEGAKVVVADIAEDAGRAIAERIGGIFSRCDVRREDDIAATIAQAVDHFGGIDIMVNNAGAAGAFAPVTQLTAEDFDATIGLLLRSVVFGFKHSLLAMQQQGRGGAVVSTASSAAFMGGIGPELYSACKGGVVSLTRAVALEQAAHGIRVNCVCPGGITTNILGASLGLTGDAAAKMKVALQDAYTGSQPIERAGRPEDIAGPIAWLASDDAAFVTGQAIIVDGGQTSANAYVASSGIGDMIAETLAATK